ncbi:MAG: site-specific integrase [Rhodospirillaceae bacterium]|nr:MAG: site-specific integrase [Rhodospirillaceae bacterium]
MPTIRRRKSGKWQVLIRLTGLKTLSRTFTTYAAAKKWALLTETQIDQGDLASGSHVLRRTSLASLLERYRDTVTTTKKSRSKERLLINALLRQPFTRLSLSVLTPQHFAEYRDLRAKTAMASTINHDLGILNQVYRLARSEWSIPVLNPLTGLKRPKADRPRDRRLLAGELDQLLKAADECRNKLVRPIIEFAIETAMRRSEIISIRWENVSQSKQTLHIPITKTDSPRTIPLSERAVSILTAQRSEPDRPFPLTVNSFDMAWKRLIARSGLQNLRFHDLRHEAVSRLFELGLTMPEVALISGHKDPRMLYRYTNLRPEDVGAKMVRLKNLTGL